MGERWVRDCVVDLEHIDACWPRCHNRRPRRHRQRRRRRLQHLQVSTRIVQLGYGGNSGDVGGGEVDENVDRAQAEITGSRSRSLCRVLGSVSLRFGLFTLRPRWDPRGRPAGGSGAPGGPLFSRAPTAVHRGARVRPERWSSPASLIDRSGPVIQHPVRSSRPAQTANPDHARRSTAVGHRRSGRCSTACRHRSNEMTCRSRADGAKSWSRVLSERADQCVSGSGSGRRGACPGGTVRHERL